MSGNGTNVETATCTWYIKGCLGRVNDAYGHNNLCEFPIVKYQGPRNMYLNEPGFHLLDFGLCITYEKKRYWNIYEDVWIALLRCI